ncbi:MAG: phosphate regulon sensor histidine kinase PhoR [Xanthomonadales bacterium]|nr:phosphate regulon sensor histidine kinase PhoR [Gammaproteobacteria bacterium]MBT8054519.1 phosphate regulon sensor histidine kinase PhoR [Gammaproteobacteria bacterium]NND56110.1 phosphate regulon sensor histidine kinase PhoR [Xanthomonadales bacterium]NNK52595.1 phosphate regulon sensor histidine kinase PhoR [Xanthomonadales bacterium]
MRDWNWVWYTAKLLLVGGAIGFGGWMAGHLLFSLIVASAIFIGWHIANLWRLYQWILEPSDEVPQSVGLWSDVFNGINFMGIRNQDQIKKSQAVNDEFKALTDAFPDAVMAVDQNGIITWFNPAAARLLRIGAHQRTARPLTSFLRDPDFAKWLSVEPKEKSPLDLPSPLHDGRWLTARAVMLQENQQLIILRDITGIHNVEQIRRDFVANISHELRTPLTVLRGYLELLEDHPSSDVGQTASRMLGQALQMQRLLDDLLELSRLQSEELRGEDELVNVPAMLNQLREQAEDLSRGDHRIVFDVDPQLCLWGVGSDLESAFGNLVTNAIKYTPRGGSIIVSWHRGTQGPQLKVSDTGIGIPSRDIPRVTERFYRVGSDRARETGGTGLGLAIVKHVLNSHQAELTITSELGVGSDLTCSFPHQRARPGLS